MDSSRNVWNSPFNKSTAFILGNEGTGLSDIEKSICDYFIYIPQYRSNTESLNVSVAAGIVLSHFAHFANFVESSREGEKYELDDITGQKAMMKRAEEIREERKQNREKDVEESLGELYPE
mmetsp:Transcript_17522/g.17469  ORF Transcript_17522/g.17469 Transcript_17522/m.17469 type:complete len:121 (+) Transcript_17522:230-592(+)